MKLKAALLATVLTLAPVMLAPVAPAVAQTAMPDPLDDRSVKRLERMEKVVRELRSIVFQGRVTGQPVVVQAAETDAQIAAPPHASVTAYNRYFLEDVRLHPYAFLGAKGVLEHLSIRICDDLVRGVLASGIENAAGAVTFFGHQGTLDIDHVRGGDTNRARLEEPRKRYQVLQGAYFTSGCYRAFLHDYV